MEQLQVLFEQMKQAFFQAVDMLVTMNMTQGTVLFLCGIAGIALCIIFLIISFAVFPGQRKRLLKKLAK